MSFNNKTLFNIDMHTMDENIIYYDIHKNYDVDSSNFRTKKVKSTIGIKESNFFISKPSEYLAGIKSISLPNESIPYFKIRNKREKYRDYIYFVFRFNSRDEYIPVSKYLFQNYPERNNGFVYTIDDFVKNFNETMLDIFSEFKSEYSKKEFENWEEKFYFPQRSPYIKFSYTKRKFILYGDQRMNHNLPGSFQIFFSYSLFKKLEKLNYESFVYENGARQLNLNIKQGNNVNNIKHPKFDINNGYIVINEQECPGVESLCSYHTLIVKMTNVEMRNTNVIRLNEFNQINHFFSDSDILASYEIKKKYNNKTLLELNDDCQWKNISEQGPLHDIQISLEMIDKEYNSTILKLKPGEKMNIEFVFAHKSLLSINKLIFH